MQDTITEMYIWCILHLLSNQEERAMMQRDKVSKMMERLRTEADKRWPALYGTHQYKHAMLVLSKSDEEVTLTDKDLLRHDLSAMCIALGIDYYQLLRDVLT